MKALQGFLPEEALRNKRLMHSQALVWQAFLISETFKVTPALLR
ncbi:hypothetical protein [Ruegeria arenilitoris]|nr:hypothetical protein [Ruegeria arenilitoris]